MEARLGALRWLPAAVGFLAATVPVSMAQQPVGPAAAAAGSIRGEVFDSLIGAPLEGANVRVRGTELRATTDGRGRFRLDAIPAGPRVLVVEHPVLDSVGLSGLTKSVDVVAGGATQVTIATPSLRTIAAAACGRPAAARRDSAIVLGVVRDAERGTRLAHARVVVSWLDIRRGRGLLRVSRRAVDILSDSLGSYHACGVPRGVALVVQAAADSFVSGELDLEVGERGLLRHDLAVSREAWGDARDSTAGPARGGATIVGSVRSEGGPPLEAVLASVPGAAAGDALSDARGRFVLAGLPSGSRMLYVRRIGYRFTAVPVDLRNRDTTVVSVELPMFSTLDTLRVTASRWVRTEIDELDRRLRLAATGRVMREEELRAAGSISTLLYSFPSLEVRTRPGGFDLQMRYGARSCRPGVWVDGWRSDVDVLEAYRPADLIALEVYNDMEVPMRYLGAFRSCGVVLAWTRYLQ